MPIYEYACEDGHTFEVIQKMTDDPVASCEVCGKPVQRVFHPVAVHFKGSGFYSTDYGSKSAAKEEGSSKKDSDSDSKPSSEKKESKKPDGKKSDGKPAKSD